MRRVMVVVALVIVIAAVGVSGQSWTPPREGDPRS